ncbi:MAG: AlkA N-terminal domain-containing protein [Pseudomonadota bacterium]
MSQDTDAPPPLDTEICRRARLARDARFDGEFFLAVRTTGIYCRPVCPARLAAEKNVSYFRTSAQAAAAGYRPCLRCRPESVPQSPAWRGSATTVHRALGMIEAGALNEQSLANLAERLGVSDRYLRKLFKRELGVSPLAVAQNQRLLFARKLLLETNMPINAVAYAAGYGSVRRFNSAFRDAFHDTPGAFRRGGRQPGRERGLISLHLQYRAPYAWQGMFNFLARHAIDGLERVGGETYWRRAQIQGQNFEFSVSPGKRDRELILDLDLQDPALLFAAVSRVRRMFDIDAHPAVVAETLAADSTLRKLASAHNGLRSPAHFSPFEAALRAVAGQQVSTSAARTVLAKIYKASATHDFEPSAITRLTDEVFAMPARRRDTIRRVCELFAKKDRVSPEELLALRGIGPWTADMYRLRGLGLTDVMPRGDLGLEQAWEHLGDGRLSLQQAGLTWRPWRSYAANLLWRSLSS